MICKNCGKELSDDSVFCTGCGTKIGAPEPEKEAIGQTADNVIENKAEESLRPEEAPKAEESVKSEETPKAEESEKPKDILKEIKNLHKKNEEKPLSETIPLPEPVPMPNNAPEPAAAYQNTPFEQTQPVNVPSRETPDHQQSDAPVPGYPEQTAAPVQEEKKSTKLSAGRKTGGTILVIFAVIFLIVLNILVCVRFGFSGDQLSKRTETLDLRTILTAEFEEEEINTDIYRMLKISSLTEGKADKDDFKNYLLNSDALEFFGEKLALYADYIIAGKGDDPTIDSEVIAEDFFGNKVNNTVAKEELGTKFDDDMIDSIRKSMEHQDVDDALSIENWGDKVGFEMNILKYAFSYITMAIVFALVIVLFIWLAVISERRSRYLLGFYGNTLFISGLIFFLIGIAVLAGMPLAFAFTSNVIFYLCANMLLPFALVALCAGFIELLLGCIFKSAAKSIKKKQKNAAKAQ